MATSWYELRKKMIFCKYNDISRQSGLQVLDPRPKTARIKAFILSEALTPCVV
jgi:hypothetical protein